jgi:hypothetical protein
MTSRLIKRFAALTAPLLLCGVLNAADKPVKVHILAGQSNMNTVQRDIELLKKTDPDVTMPPKNVWFVEEDYRGGVPKGGEWGVETPFVLDLVKEMRRFDMTLRSLSVTPLAAATLLSLLAAPPVLAAAQKATVNPDFTQGGEISKGSDHDWTLGATGARGWMYSEKLCTTDARQIAITEVDKGSPADGLLQKGDVILGVGGKPFSFDPRTEMGRALTAAESETGGGNLSLTRWRAGKTDEVVVKLPVLGTYSATAPYDCPKSKRILEQGCKALARQMAKPSYKLDAIPRCLNALALLASGDPEYIPLVRKEAQWASGFTANGMQTWYYGYVMILLAEYVMATDDLSVMPGLKRLAMEAAKGQSIVGSWGHGFAEPDGRLGGYGMMNSPGVPLTIGLAMARDAGVKDPEVGRAVERSIRLLRFYVGKGAIPYGDHHPWTQTHEDNGKCGMTAVLFNHLRDNKAAEYFSRMCVASHSAERDCGHTGNFFNMLWAMPGVALSGPNATGAWMKEFGSWYFDLARRWDGTFLHQGPPELRPDKYKGWDCTGAYLLAYAMPLKKIHLTGKRPAIVPALDPAGAEALIRDGRGWSNKDRNSAYDAMSRQELLTRLGSWSPTVRERAAVALVRLKIDAVPALIEMLEAPRVEARYGACEALAQYKAAAVSAVPALMKAFRHEDLWLRVKAAEALADIGQPAMSVLPDLLERLAKGPSPEDPRGMEQRYLCFSVFDNMLKKSLDGVDREQLRKAVTAGLQNEDGRARSSIGSVYRLLSYDEIKPLLPVIHEAIVKPAPSGIMFADGIRLAGLDLFAQHRIREGVSLCLDIIDIDRHGKRNRITRCLNTLEQYGAAAKPLLPRLQQLEKDLLAHWEAKGLQPQIDQLRALMKKIEGATGTVELRSLQ